MLGNTIEAAADLGGMAAALGIFIPLPIPWIVVMVAVVLLALQVLASYATIRSIFRWLALALLAYVAAALLAQPNPGEVLAGTLLPSVRFDREFLSIVVAIIGTSLSAISTPGNPTSRSRRRLRMARLAFLSALGPPMLSSRAAGAMCSSACCSPTQLCISS